MNRSIQDLRAKLQALSSDSEDDVEPVVEKPKKKQPKKPTKKAPASSDDDDISTSEDSTTSEDEEQVVKQKTKTKKPKTKPQQAPSKQPPPQAEKPASSTKPTTPTTKSETSTKPATPTTKPAPTTTPTTPTTTTTPKTKRPLDNEKILQAKKKKNIDVLFMLDATGSMGAWIAETKSKIHEIVKGVQTQFEGYTIRVSYVAYRDFSDANRVQSMPFTENPQEFATSLAGVPAQGGGDAPEDVFIGLETTAKQDWASHIRILFHIADAPPHGATFHDLGAGADNYYTHADYTEANCKLLLQKLRDQNIRNYFFISINDSTAKMEKFFLENYSKQDGFLFKVGKLGSNPSQFLKFVMDSISVSVTSSFGLGLDAAKKKE